MTTPEPEHSREIPRELLQEILLTLPTRDVARSCCVSRLWRDSVRDPSFRSLHGKARHVICGAAETLLVSEKRKRACSDEAGVFNVSSGRALGRIAIVKGYVLGNVCNGFLCFAHGGRRSGMEAPVQVCNPATGETMMLPDAPPRLFGKDRMHLFVLGFSPPTNEYKLFRLWFRSCVEYVDVDVYTLGGSAGEWRKLWWYPCVYSRPMESWAPVLIDGMLYVSTLPSNHHFTDSSIPREILVIDVCTEMCHTYPLPHYWTYDCDGKQPVNAFELNGRLCFAAHARDNRQRFWVMSSPPRPEDSHNDDYNMDGELCWDLCYIFDMRDSPFTGLPCAGWLGDNGMLYYMQGSTLHIYDTRGQLPPSACKSYEYLQWDQQVNVNLPTTPLLPGCRWPSIYGGYRPTLLSPLTLRPQDDDVNDEDRYQLEHAMLSKLYDATSKTKH